MFLSEILESRRLFAATLVNVGGGAFTDAAGHKWSADFDGSGGKGNKTYAGIAGTTDDALYQTYRAGVFTYSLPLPNRNYAVTLHFAEPSATAAGQRVFNIAAEGVTRIKNLDLFATAGKNTAVKKTFSVVTTGGHLELLFKAPPGGLGGAGEAIVSAIEVNAVAAGLPAPPVSLTAVATSPTTVALNWVDRSTDETGFRIERSTDGGKNFHWFAKPDLNANSFLDATVEAQKTYAYRVRAANENGYSAYSNIAKTTPPRAQTSFTGGPFSIPGTIEAENFDDGGKLVSYADTTAGNATNLYRKTDVDIYATTDTGGGYRLGATRPGEWVEYTLKLATPGTFGTYARIASANAGGYFSLSFTHLKEVVTTASIDFVSTGDWANYRTVGMGRVTLGTAGTWVMRLTFDSSRDTTKDIGDLNWIKLVSTTPPVVTPPATTTTTTTTTATAKRIADEVL